VFFHADAAWRDVLVGYLHALAMARGGGELGGHGTAQAHVTAAVAAAADGYIAGLERKGWWVGQPLLEPDASLRVRLEGLPGSVAALAGRDAAGR
jgi:hypothetical protein